MLLFAAIFLLFTALSAASPVQPQVVADQNVLDISDARPLQGGNPRKLRGRFLHITDVHPDPFYKRGTDPDGDHPCHAGHGAAGYFGAEKTECDSPFSLINATFDWIKHNIKDEIDFVVWTGDSARHDNDDDKYPRTIKQIEQLNRYVVDKFDEVFGKPDNRHDPDPTNDFVVPIVPTFGNNDILPHNILGPGPNKWTQKYLSIWEKFVPQEQRHSFARGGWFFTEVIPNKLAVFSLNTLYFFESNAAVDGCDASSEPGYEHFEWLRIQLGFLRQRNMKAILIGHVPPARTESKQNWDESCYQKYNLWLRQYRDVVVGNIFGHMNIDHFILHDVRELTYKFQIPGIDDQGLRDGRASISDTFSSQAKADYLDELRQHWGNLPTPPHGSAYTGVDVHVKKSKSKKKKEQLEKFLKEIGGPYGERFSLSVISPSIVPNFYPTLRVIEYNITGMEHDHPALIPTAPIGSDLRRFELEHDLDEQETQDDDLENDIDISSDFEIAKKKKHKKKHKKKQGKKPKPNFVIPQPPPRSAPPGPGYSPQPLSLVSWTQLYANLTKINEAVAKELQYRDDEIKSGVDDELQKEVMKRHFEFEIEYNTSNDSFYSMRDLTVRSWLDYAEKISRAKFTPKQLDIVTDLATDECEASHESNDTECSDDYNADPSLKTDELSLEEFSGLYKDESELDIVHNAHATSISPSPGLDTVDDEYHGGEDDTSDGPRISLECLIYLWKLKSSALKVYNPHDNDEWPWNLLKKLKPELMIEQCTKYLDKSDFSPDSDKDNDGNQEDSGYDSDSNSNSDLDSEDDASDSGYDDSEDTTTTNNDDNDASTTKHKKHKNKHRKHKKSKRRKGFNLKNNHLWHRFVKRAFVETKTWDELKDEFG